MGITKDAETIICFIYKLYLERRKSGESKSGSRRFSDDFYKSDRKLSKWHENDVYECLTELKRKGYIKMYINGDIELLDNTIVYMESRFKNGLSEVLEVLSKFIP
ncbi:MAG: hypothetical protein NC489_22255 [Ruminococcus flavefaciens]|nr:hypothetical protein [Ruminococcus flavefaciens]